MPYDNTDLLSRVFVDEEAIKLRHQSMLTGYMVIQPNHPNYAHLYSLALLAATNRLRIRIRTYSNSETNVQYLVIEWG